MGCAQSCNLAGSTCCGLCWDSRAAVNHLPTDKNKTVAIACYIVVISGNYVRLHGACMEVAQHDGIYLSRSSSVRRRLVTRIPQARTMLQALTLNP